LFSQWIKEQRVNSETARKLRFSLISSCVAFSTALTLFAAPPVHLDRKGEHWADATLRKMSLEEKIGQMIMPWAHI